MATDILEIFGTEYSGVTGIKATDSNNNILTYVRPQGTISITSSGTIDVAAYASASVAAGAAGTPTISINTSTGVITATSTRTAGYIGSGTTSSTYSLTTQAAATITPTKSSQTAVAANRYTTGAVTVAAIPAAYQDVTGVTASAADVLSGKTIVNSSGITVNGSLVIQHYYTGSGTPSAATGSNGDIYLKTS